MDDSVDVEVYRRRLSVSLEGFTPMETAAVAALVDEKMQELAASTGQPDTGKLAILTAISFASDLYTLKHQLESIKKTDETRITEMLLLLESELKT